ncbi:MAG: DNA polymerase/3'-5' exonuclease PolX [Nitrospiraceae bacterium]|nr:DNA polymerase/3'-5' exonuclease PolX [Nitrospiraceae bacterium]MDA8089753.1 DNA polymerase/3'-5' exonuclease PolX [Nitrospiraceae bacterium]
MINSEAARIFSEIADMLELSDENPFRVRAYRRAAMVVEGHPSDISKMSKEELKKIPGIGEDLASKLMEIVQTGTCKAYETAREKIPEGLSLLLTVPGLGPKTARAIYEKFRIKDIAELAKLAAEHRLKGAIPKIKEKTEQNILRGIGLARMGTERKPIGKILPVALELINALRARAPVKQLEIAGSLRRWKETIGDIDILATSKDPGKVMDVFTGLSKIRQVIAKGDTKSTVILTEGVQADLRVVEEGAFGAALCYFTGSKEHNIRLREMGVKKGLKINEYGIFDKKGKRIGGEKEVDVYQALGLPLVPPELREDSGEIEAALKGELPNLVRIEDIKGDLHVHTKQSDGNYSIDEIVQAAMKRGWSYVAITDHSKGLGIARGLDEERLLDEIRQIDAINRKLDKTAFRVLKGVEVDIRSDRALDFPDDILSKLDVVNASVHSGFRQTKEKITGRIIAAMENPFVTTLSHPTGRLLGERDSYQVDMEAVLRTALETGTALEINSFPSRLDLNDTTARRAGDMGIPIVINTDAHILDHFSYMSYGVAIARRAWLEPKNIANTLNVKELLELLHKKRLIPLKKS